MIITLWEYNRMVQYLWPFPKQVVGVNIKILYSIICSSRVVLWLPYRSCQARIFPSMINPQPRDKIKISSPTTMECSNRYIIILKDIIISKTTNLSNLITHKDRQDTNNLKVEQYKFLLSAFLRYLTHKYERMGSQSIGYKSLYVNIRAHGQVGCC